MRGKKGAAMLTHILVSKHARDLRISLIKFPVPHAKLGALSCVPHPRANEGTESLPLYSKLTKEIWATV